MSTDPLDELVTVERRRLKQATDIGYAAGAASRDAEVEALRKRVQELEGRVASDFAAEVLSRWQARAERAEAERDEANRLNEQQAKTALECIRDKARAEAELAAAREDAERLEWLTRNVSGAELRAIGVMWPAWSMENARAAIDAARASTVPQNLPPSA